MKEGTVNILLFWAQGFEDLEAVAIPDVLGGGTKPLFLIKRGWQGQA